MPDISPDQAIQALRGLPEDRQRAILAKLSPEVKTGIMAKLKPPAAPKPMDRTPENYVSEIASGVGRGIVNDVTGVAQAAMHPIDTAESLLKQANESGEAAGKEFRDLKGVPIVQRLGATALAGLEKAPVIGGMVQHAEQGGERMGSPEAAGAAAEGITTFAAPELLGPATKALKATSESMRKGITGTGTKVTAELVKNAKAGDAVADAHLRTQSAIETARNNALKEGNAKYSAVNEKLSHLPADMDKLQGAYADAAQSFGETQGMPPIIKRLEGAMKEPLTYADEQKLYSELGKELSKGSLPGTTYHAYDMLHEAVGQDMQRIADSQGAGAELTGARSYWRRMKQTFGKPMGETDTASSVLRSESPEMARHAETSNRIRMMGSFDPEIPKAFGDLQKARAAAKDAPPTVPGEKTKIGAQEVQGAKAQALTKKVDDLRVGRSKYANTLTAFDVIRNALSGNVGGIVTDLAVRGVYGLGKKGLANLFERPEVMEFLTKPTTADMALIPPDMRGEFPEIIHEAQNRGIKVSPRLLAAFKIAAITGPKTKKLQEMRRGFVETGTDQGNALPPQ